MWRNSGLRQLCQEPLRKRIIWLDGQDGFELVPDRVVVPVFEDPARPEVHVVEKFFALEFLEAPVTLSDSLPVYAVRNVLKFRACLPYPA